MVSHLPSLTRTGQQYKQREQRRGALWEDRYHVKAVEGGEHLIRCLVYIIDPNMVRAGVVWHPNQWPCLGYREIQNRKQRHGIVDYERLIELLRMKDRLVYKKVATAEWKKRYAVRNNADRPSGQRALRCEVNSMSEYSRRS